MSPVERVTCYSVFVSCPRCRGELTHCASGTPGLDTRAVARCDRCAKHWQVTVEIVDVSGEVRYVKPRAGEAA